MTDLVSITDPDYTSFTNGEPAYFLKMAGEAVRAYCGWHIYPSVTETGVKRPLGERGIIMLPTTYLTDVASLTVDGSVVDPSDYHWWKWGSIQRVNRYSRDGYCLVDFTHGYDELPADIKAVVMEVADAAEQMASGGVKGVTTPGYSITYGSSGLTISGDMGGRLANYRLGSVI